MGQSGQNIAHRLHSPTLRLRLFSGAELPQASAAAQAQFTINAEVNRL
jgi:hypothetical protein